MQQCAAPIAGPWPRPGPSPLTLGGLVMHSWRQWCGRDGGAISGLTSTCQRQLDIELFIRSQYIRQVRRLLDPRPFPGKDLVRHFVAKVYGPLRMGWRLFASNCDFLMLDADSTPTYWRYVLKMYGSMQGLVPNVSQATSRAGAEQRR